VTAVTGEWLLFRWLGAACRNAAVVMPRCSLRACLIATAAIAVLAFLVAMAAISHIRSGYRSASIAWLAQQATAHHSAAEFNGDPADPSPLHIAMSFSPSSAAGAALLVAAALRDQSRSVEFHMVVDQHELARIRPQFDCLLDAATRGVTPAQEQQMTIIPAPPASIHWYPIDPGSAVIAPFRLDNLRLKSQFARLRSWSNFCRFALHRILPPHLDVVVYADADLIPLGSPVAQLGQLADVLRRGPVRSGAPATAALVQDPELRLADWLVRPEATQRIFRARYGVDLDVHQAVGNAGVVALSLTSMRSGAFVDHVRFWLAANADLRLWNLGSQPPLLLVLLGLDQVAWLPDTSVNFQSHNVAAQLRSGASLPNIALLHNTGGRKFHDDAFRADVCSDVSAGRPATKLFTGKVDPSSTQAIAAMGLVQLGRLASLLGDQTRPCSDWIACAAVACSTMERCLRAK
jgi:hypothetical protein